MKAPRYTGPDKAWDRHAQAREADAWWSSPAGLAECERSAAYWTPERRARHQAVQELRMAMLEGMTEAEMVAADPDGLLAELRRITGGS